MRIRSTMVWLTLMAVLSTSPAWAQQHAANTTAMQQAVAEKASADQANRDVVTKVLDRQDVRQLAATMGVDVQQAKTAVSTMSGADLDQLAQPARAIDADRVGGANVVVISVTTLLLLLILIIVIAK
ncbi:MAG: PA2779 family protein [Vicinamibacterales bacterium]